MIRQVVHRQYLRRFLLGACLLLCALSFSGRADTIPLRGGRSLDVQVLSYDQWGITVQGRYGALRIPWAQISRSFPQHPDHVDRPAAADGAAASASSEESNSPGKNNRHARRNVLNPGDITIPLGIDPFLGFMIVAFLWFWLNVLSVWLVSREDIEGGSRYQAWNLAALIIGPPVAVFYLLRYRGLRGLFRFRQRRGDGTPLPAKGAVAESCLFTWDGQPLKPQRRRSRSSGLVSAQAILARAAHMNASDIHFDTTPYGVDVKFRVDGALRQPESLDPEAGKRTVAAIKMAAGIDVAKRQDAQDGACHLAVDKVWFDLRVARAWAVNGETVTVRLLRTSGLGGGELTDLGLSDAMAGVLREVIQQTAGIIILAGPTGSGKTSTIYALLRRIVGTGRNILTIEDPVEYRLDGATQISLNSRSGSTFSSALKASMRHDPDVILVGEIRDAGTMEVAFQAGLTGHLVFTTIHASSVLATIGRLHEMGLSAYMINTGLKTIVCQRLVRLLCPSCREPYTPDTGELSFWGITPEEAAGKFFYRPRGCRLCEETGYHGRRGVFRILFMNNNIREMIRPDIAMGDLQKVVDDNVLGQPRDYVDSLLWMGLTSPMELKLTLDMFDFGKHLGGPEGPAPAANATAIVPESPLPSTQPDPVPPTGTPEDTP